MQKFLRVVKFISYYNFLKNFSAEMLIIIKISLYMYYKIISHHHRSKSLSDQNKEIPKIHDVSTRLCRSWRDCVADVIRYRCVPNNPITSEMLPWYK